MAKKPLSKVANFIVVGGPISVGKSTVVSKLSLPQVYEVDNEDDLQGLLLFLLYEKKRVANEIVELYFLFSRIRKYQQYSTTLTTHVFDRSIVESLWFAENTLSPLSFGYFKQLWFKEVRTLFAEFGKPKLYFLLTCSWATFEKRIFTRARQAEVENYQQNVAYFKKHVQEYEEYTKQLFKTLGIKSITIATDNMSADEVARQIQQAVDRIA